jgi:hypothetical protein
LGGWRDREAIGDGSRSQILLQKTGSNWYVAYAGDEAPTIELTPEEEADLIEAPAEVARGEIASEAEVSSALSKYRL